MAYPRLMIAPGVPPEALTAFITRGIVPVPFMQWEAQRAHVCEMMTLLAAMRERTAGVARAKAIHRLTQVASELDRLYGLLPEPAA